MYRGIGIALLALPLLALPARANGPFGFTVGASGTFSFFIAPGGGGAGGGGAPAQAGPWYLYWPLDAHFVHPAPTGYPYWPPSMGLQPMNGDQGSQGFQGPARGAGSVTQNAPYYWNGR